jgi:hypothetical protein
MSTILFFLGIKPYGCKNCFKEFEKKELMEEHHGLCKFRKTMFRPPGFQWCSRLPIQYNSSRVLVHLHS